MSSESIYPAAMSMEPVAETKLEEASMWLGKDLQELNEPNPYPRSHDPKDPVIGKTAPEACSLPAGTAAPFDCLPGRLATMLSEWSRQIEWFRHKKETDEEILMTACHQNVVEVVNAYFADVKKCQEGQPESKAA